MTNQVNNNPKQLDSYSLLIVSKYFETTQDYINVISVNSKFKETTEKLRFNPISITSLKLFPKIQTQYLYNEDDIKIEGIDNYEIWYEVDYAYSLIFSEERIKTHHIKYTQSDMNYYGKITPKKVTVLACSCKKYYKPVGTITVGNNITSIRTGYFSWCDKLNVIELPKGLSKLHKSSFYGCESLTAITIPPSLQSIESCCFYNCESLQSITIPIFVTELGDSCFFYCTSLKSIVLPTSLQVLKGATFQKCYSLSSITIPTTVRSIGNYCFSQCRSLTTITLPPKLKSIGNWGFSFCSNLVAIEGLNDLIESHDLKIGEKCFFDCSSFKFNWAKPNYGCCIS
ncbi:F-box domain-containing protein [Entamoeba marina]